MTMAMELIRHIAGLYGGKAIKGDFTQVYITGNEIWMAQQVLAEQAEGAQGELWAVHAQGPDDLYAAFSREDAEKHAADLNALPMPEGISVGAVVIPSPWLAAEHWKYLAEQEREHKDTIEGQRRNLAATLLSQNHELMEVRAALAQPSPIRCQCCGYLVTDSEHRGCLRSAYPVVATKNDDGQIVAVTRQDAEGQVVDVIAEAQPSPAPEVERPEVVAWSSWKVGTRSHVPFRTEEEAARSVNASEIAATQEGPYSVEPLMTVAQHKRIDAARLASVRVLADEVLELAAQRDAAQAMVAEMERRLDEEFSAHGTTIGQRDAAEQWADDLAQAIGEKFGVEIGEHSNLNCPWEEALNWIQAGDVSHAPVAQAGQVPEKPTEAMLQAGMNAMAEAQRNGSQSLYAYAGVCWDAMLAAAPQPAEGDGIDHAWCDGVCDE